MRKVWRGGLPPAAARVGPAFLQRPKAAVEPLGQRHIPREGRLVERTDFLHQPRRQPAASTLFVIDQTLAETVPVEFVEANAVARFPPVRGAALHHVAGLVASQGRQFAEATEIRDRQIIHGFRRETFEFWT